MLHVVWQQVISTIENFGQVPPQLFKKPHPEQPLAGVFLFPVVSRATLGCPSCACIHGLLTGNRPPIRRSAKSTTPQCVPCVCWCVCPCVCVRERVRVCVPMSNVVLHCRHPQRLYAYPSFREHDAPIVYMGFPRSKNHCVVVVDASRAWRVHNCKAKSREPEDRPPFLLTVDGRCGPLLRVPVRLTVLPVDSLLRLPSSLAVRRTAAASTLRKPSTTGTRDRV